MLWVLVLGAILIWAPPPAITHRSNVGRGHTQIKPKPCEVNGVEGTCMFVYDCIKTDGKHVGMCVDNFMFGSCCSHNITHNTVATYHQPVSNVIYSQSNEDSSPRPSSITSFPINARPHFPQSQLINSKVRPSKPISFITRTTRRPLTTTHRLTDSSTSTQKPTTIGKPWTNKPPHFVTSPARPVQTTVTSLASNSSGLVVQSLVVVPHNSSLYGNSLPVTKNASYTSVYDLIVTLKPPHNESSVTTKTSIVFVNNTNSEAVAIEDNTIASWSTSKPLWSGSPFLNEILTSSKPFLHSSKPEYWSSGKPNSYVNKPWQSSTKPAFVTRPRPSSNISNKPKPTRKPVSIITASGLIRKNYTASLSSPSTSTTTMTTTSTTTSTVATEIATSQTTTPVVFTSTITTPTTPTTPREMVSEALTTKSSTTLLSEVSKYQYSGQCGVAALSPRPEMRIVGGKNAPFGGWPWQVSVRRTSFFGFSSTHRCGGAVINENWIATAGHCVDDLLTSQIRIRVGEYDFSSVMEPYPFVERAASKKVVHPKYNFFTYEYDLALVRLDSPLEFQPHISPICLPASDDLLIGENATVTGWGRLSEGGTLPSVLQQVSVPIVSNDKCKSMFLRAGRHEFIPEIFLCAGHENGGQDSCQGDSGGPLQVKGKNGRYFLAGIISWGIGCAEANLPGVCTRISKFVPWILENVT